MRFIVYGAGAVGGVVGGHLAQQGHDVVLVARGAHRDALAAGGLCMEFPGGSIALTIPVAGAAEEVDWRTDDVVLLAVKSHHTPAALDDLADSAFPTTPVVCLQNGVANEPLALRRFRSVYGAGVVCPAVLVAPGVVHAHWTPTAGIIDLGRYPGGIDDTARTIATALDTSSFRCQAVPDILRWKYGKLLLNLKNAVDALCGPVGWDSRLIGLAIDEGREVLAAAGIDVAQEAADPTRWKSLSVQNSFGQRHGGGSTWQSLSRGAGSLETPYLNGEIVMLGRLHGHDTPVNELLLAAVSRAARAGLSPGHYSEGDLLARLGDGPR